MTTSLMESFRSGSSFLKLALAPGNLLMMATDPTKPLTTSDLASRMTYDRPKQKPPEEVVSREYNFIIVGGGTAGLALAARLTELHKCHVLVLEAGEEGHRDINIEIPTYMGELYEDENYDWCFKTAPQEHIGGRVIAQPVGKILGGTSAINYMVRSDPSNVDLDNWEKLGNAGWNWETLSPYYRKFETYNGPEELAEASAAGQIQSSSLADSPAGLGPVQITPPHATSELDLAFLQTLHNLDITLGQDPRGGAGLGAYPALKYIDRGGYRSYAANAFYTPIASRENLTVLTGAHVMEVRFESLPGPIPIASGVKFLCHGKYHTAKASAEVILCAGSIQSPRILEHSGIGSRIILDHCRIGIRVENPYVGENLQDHVFVPLSFEAKDGLNTAESLQEPSFEASAIKDWCDGRRGALASGISGTAFLSHLSIPDLMVKHRQEAEAASLAGGPPESLFITFQPEQLNILRDVYNEQQEADIQLIFSPTGMNPTTGTNLSSLFKHSDPGHYVSIAAVSCHPFSVGQTHIRSVYCDAQPDINPCYLSHPLDSQILADAILYIQRVFNSAPLGGLIKNSPDYMGKKVQPSFELPLRLDQDTVREFVLQRAISAGHAVGTCAMLPRGAGGVVDTKLRVYGVKKLRVVDASVMPLHVRGDIASTVYAIAERAADLIKDEYVQLR